MPLAAAERRFIKDVRAQLDREEAARTRVLLADFALGRFGCAV